MTWLPPIFIIGPPLRRFLSAPAAWLGQVWSGPDSAGPDWLRWAGLLLITLVLFAPGCQTIPATDRDESRYAQASRQIIESGDWVDIRFQDELRLKKPPAIYWLQAGSRLVLGLPDSIGSYRLASLLGAVGAVLVLFALSRRLLASELSMLPPLMLAASFLVGAEARLATTDAVLLLATMLAGSVLTLRWAGRPWPQDDLILATAMAAGVLVKGPVVLFLVGGMYATGRIPFRLQGLPGLFTWRALILFIILAAPWFVLIAIRHGAAFWYESVLQDVAGKAVSAQESHGYPPGFYLLTLPLAGWPWAALLPAMGWLAWRERGQPAARALMAWILPLWALFELAPTKLVHYVLPTYPALVLLGTLAWCRRSEWPGFVRWACITLLLCGATALAGAGAWLAGRFSPHSADGWLFAGMLVGSATLFLMVPRPAVLLAGVAATWLQWWAVVVPGMDELWLSRRAALLVERIAPGCEVVSQGFAEPSLVFELGTRIRFGSPQPVSEGARCRVLLRTRDHPNERTEGERTQYAGHLSGVNYAKGRPVHLDIYFEAFP